MSAHRMQAKSGTLKGGGTLSRLQPTQSFPKSLFLRRKKLIERRISTPYVKNAFILDQRSNKKCI